MSGKMALSRRCDAGGDAVAEPAAREQQQCQRRHHHVGTEQPVQRESSSRCVSKAFVSRGTRPEGRLIV
jgi:hypothetical protein